VTFRRRLDHLEERVPPQVQRIRSEAARRVKRITDLLAEAERPDASPETRARAARVRELLKIAEQRRDRAEREPWKGHREHGTQD
jgi:hypothetical protein